MCGLLMLILLYVGQYSHKAKLFYFHKQTNRCAANKRPFELAGTSQMMVPRISATSDTFPPCFSPTPVSPQFPTPTLPTTPNMNKPHSLVPSNGLGVLPNVFFCTV